MIICITGWFKTYDDNGVPTGRSEFVTSHGIDTITDEKVILPNVHPVELGAEFDGILEEWIIDETST